MLILDFGFMYELHNLVYREKLSLVSFHGSCHCSSLVFENSNKSTATGNDTLSLYTRTRNIHVIFICILAAVLVFL